ncbi:MAG TPA: PE-PPE domain-containing protein [Pseudonocardiaceae bacterium]|nr:PE-PPE domain-containing protein [Pseudonocardiaceae bacterium]
MKKRRRAAAAVAALVAGLLGATASIAHAQQPHYYILIGGTCDGNAAVYNHAWLRGGIPRIVHYPAGGEGLCNGNTPMDQSVAQGYEEAKRVVRAAYTENPGALFTVVGYSQGAIVGNQVLNDIADDKLGVNKSRFSVKFYADPMQPETGISAKFPAGTRLPPPGTGYVSYGPGRTQFNGIQFIRYCIQTDGICDFTSPQAPGGYYAQHFCYPRARPTDRRSIMGDTIADGVYTNASEWLQKQDCHSAGPPPGDPFLW